MKRDLVHGVRTTGTIRKLNFNTGEYGYCANNENNAPSGCTPIYDRYRSNRKSRGKSKSFREKHRNNCYIDQY